MTFAFKFKKNLVLLSSILLSCSIIGQEVYFFDALAGSNRFGSALERALVVKENGIDGTGFIINGKRQLEAIKEFKQTDLALSNQLSIPFVYLSIADVNKVAQESHIKELFASFPGSPVWINFSVENDSDFRKLIKRLCAEARKVGSDIVLYPKVTGTFKNVEDIIFFIKKLQEPNLYASFTLNYELKSGNGDRIFEVILDAAPYLKFIVVRGMDIVKEKEDIHLTECLAILKKINFKGAVVFSLLFAKEEDSFTDFIAKVASKLEEKKDAANFERTIDIHWHEKSKSWLTISAVGNEKKNDYLSGAWLTNITDKGKNLGGKWLKQLVRPRILTSNKKELYIFHEKGIVLVDPKTKKVTRNIYLPHASEKKINPSNISVMNVDNKGNIYLLDATSNKIICFSINEERMDLFFGNSSEKILDFCLDKKRLFYIASKQESLLSKTEIIGMLNLKNNKHSVISKHERTELSTNITKHKNNIYLFGQGNEIKKISKRGALKTKYRTDYPIHNFGFDKKKREILVSRNNNFFLHKIDSFTPFKEP